MNQYNIAKKILKSLEKKTDIDYCGLTENEVINIIIKVLNYE